MRTGLLVFGLLIGIFYAYYTTRRWLVAHIVATLAAGAKADPFRAEYVRGLIKERNRIEAERLKPAALESEELSKWAWAG